MASNTKGIIFDLNGKPAPQFYNPTTDAYEPVQGQNGGPRATILGPDGTPVSSTNAFPVQLTGSNPTDAKTPGIGDVNALHSGYNGATWDRWRNNTEAVIFASAARTTSLSSATQTNYNGRGVLVVLDITAASGTGGLKLAILGIDSNTGTSFSILAASPAAFITAIGRYTFLIYPGLVEGAAVTGTSIQSRLSAILPRKWRVDVFTGDATSYTYSVSHSNIL